MIIDGPCWHCDGAGCWRCHNTGNALRYVEHDTEQADLANAWFASHPNHWLTRLAQWWDNRSTWHRQ